MLISFTGTKMIIHGLNKLTLLDYPNHTACTVFTGGCNFCCPFCHNAPLVINPNKQPVIDETEILNYLKKRQGILDGICITGGEPTINKDLPQFIEKVKKLGYLVKLDTNGTAPDLIEKLIDKKLVDYIAMDIKNSKDAYPQTVGIHDYKTDDIEKSVKLIMDKAREYEFRTTVVKEFHNEDNFKKIGKWLKGAKSYYLQAFEDSGNLISNNLHGYSKAELENFKNILTPYFETVKIRGID